MKLSHRHARTPKNLRGCKTGRKRALSDEQVADIRRLYDEVEESSYPSLAREFKVNASTIRFVVQYLGVYADV